MLARILTGALLGIDADPVEVNLAPGLPSFATVALPDVAVREATNRGNAALTNTGFEFRARRTTADYPRSGWWGPLRKAQAGGAPRP